MVKNKFDPKNPKCPKCNRKLVNGIDLERYEEDELILVGYVCPCGAITGVVVRFKPIDEKYIVKDISDGK